MLKSLALPLITALALAACGDDSSSDIDAMTPSADAPVAIDAPGDFPDAAGIIDASPPDAPAAPDAPIVVPDATSPSADAGPPPTDIPTICMNACAKIFACMMPPMPVDPGCQAGCEADLADCTPAQLDAVNACNMVDCSADPMAPITCLMMISCIMG